MSGVRRRNVRAIAPPHQHAILGLAQIRNAHGKPYSDCRQRDGKSERRDVRQHAVMKIVRLFPISLVARQIIRFLPAVGLPNLIAPVSPLTRRVNRGARPKFEHAVFVFRSNGPLGFHWCRFRDFLLLYLARSRTVRQTMLTWHRCDILALLIFFPTDTLSRPMLYPF